VAIPGDIMVDWLAEGGQTVDMRTLWQSHVRLLATAGLTTLISIVDRDDGAAVHQGSVLGGGDDSMCMLISPFLGRWCLQRTLKNTRKAKYSETVHSRCLGLGFSIPMVCSSALLSTEVSNPFMLHRRAMEVSGQNETVHTTFADVRPRFHRAMTRPFFSKERISDFELFDRHADQVLSKMKERFREGVAVDVQDVLFRFTMDTATEFLFGQDVKSLSADLPYPSTCKKASPRTHPSDRFAFAFNRAQENALPRGFYGKLWRLVDFWEDVVARDRETAHEFIDPLIQAALEKKRAAKGVYEVNLEDSTLLDHLVHQTDGTRNPFCCV